MFFLALPPIQQVQTTFATQLANGIEPRAVYQDGQLVARGIEVTQIVGGRKHFFSHTQNDGGATEVDAWLDADDHPISAQYSMHFVGGWVTMSAELSGDTVTMKRESSTHDADKVVTSKLPPGRVSTLAQFDPLKLFPRLSIGKSIDISVIDPLTMSVFDGTLVETEADSKGPLRRVFNLSTSTGSNLMVVTADGKVDLVQNSTGQMFRPTGWDAFLLNIADLAGYRVNDVLRAEITGLITPRATQPTVTTLGGKKHG